jgi:hypothetical protein
MSAVEIARPTNSKTKGLDSGRDKGAQQTKNGRTTVFVTIQISREPRTAQQTGINISK